MPAVAADRVVAGAPAHDVQPLARRKHDRLRIAGPGLQEGQPLVEAVGVLEPRLDVLDLPARQALVGQRLERLGGQAAPGGGGGGQRRVRRLAAPGQELGHRRLGLHPSALGVGEGYGGGHRVGELEVLGQVPEAAVLGRPPRRELHRLGVHVFQGLDQLAGQDPLALAGHPLPGGNRAPEARLSDLLAPLRRGGLLGAPGVVEGYAVDGVGKARQQVLAGDVGGHLLGAAKQRVAEPGAALHDTEIEIARGDRGQGGEVVLAQLAIPGEVKQRGLLVGAVGHRVGLAGRGALEQVVGAQVVDVGGRAGIAAEQARRVEGKPSAQVLHLPEGRLPHQEQRLVGGAAAVAPAAGARGLDPARQVHERRDQLPHLDVAHVALGVEHRRAPVGAVEHVLGPHALGGDLEVHDRRGVPVLVDAAALEHVARDAVGADHLLDEAAGVDGARDHAGKAGERRLQERPGDPGRARGVAQVGDRPLGKIRLQRQVGAVVDLVVADQGLGELHPDRPLHPRRRAVHRVIAPRRAAVVVELECAVAVDAHLERRVHHEVALGVGGERGLAREGDVHERRRAVAPGYGHLPDAGLKRAPALLDHLAHELLEAVDALLEDHPLDPLADHVAAGQAGAFVEQVVHRRTGLGLDPAQVPGGQLVAIADLHARQVDAVLEAVGGAHGHPAGRGGADVEHVGHPTRPRHQLLLPEDGHERLHVGVVHVADGRLVVGEDVARPHARVALVVAAHHPLDGVGHGVDVDDDPGRQGDRVPLGRIEGKAQLAQLAHDRRGGDVHRRLPGGHQPAAQAREQLLVADRVRLLELQALEPEVMAGALEQLLGFLEHLLQAASVPAERRGLGLQRAGGLDDGVHGEPPFGWSGSATERRPAEGAWPSADR